MEAEEVEGDVIGRGSFFIYTTSLTPVSRCVRMVSHGDFSALSQSPVADLSIPAVVCDGAAEADTASPLWATIRKEAEIVAREDLQASVLISNAILAQKSFEEALCNYLAIQLEGPLLPATQIKNTFLNVVKKNESIAQAWAWDLLATALRDSAYPNIVDVFLFSKGFHALAAYRIANTLWYNQRDGLARFFQSLISRSFGSDLHPAAHIGRGCYFASGSHLVIGETASVGRDCSLEQGVTLGGTGKQHGDRHPKVGDRVSLKAGATVLGNIAIASDCQILADSVLTKSVPAYSILNGVPAKIVGNVDPAESVSLCRQIHSIVAAPLDTPWKDVYDIFCRDYLAELKGKIENV
eukprot:scaffold198_cov169-Ochromonas_danica.AAC.22